MLLRFVFFGGGMCRGSAGRLSSFKQQRQRRRSIASHKLSYSNIHFTLLRDEIQDYVKYSRVFIPRTFLKFILQHICKFILLFHLPFFREA